MSTDKRNIIICIGVTAVVYLIFKYIMPLAAPFIIAFLLAAGLNGQLRQYCGCSVVFSLHR